MRILNFGSLNIDHVYRVPHLVRPGETLDSTDYRVFAGGKGGNQSIALARAGAQVYHAGKVGRDGRWLVANLQDCGVLTGHIAEVDAPTGHAIIQVGPDGQNAILLQGGANRLVTAEDARRVLADFGDGDMLLLQNELSGTADLLREGKRRGLRMALNPAPMDATIAACPLELVDILVVNEIEGAALAGTTEPDAIVAELTRRLPRTELVLTLGEQGARYACGPVRFAVPADKAAAVDTTAAGDTFIGYLLAELGRGASPEQAVKMACRAAAVCVTRAGAAASIPARAELG